MKSLKKFLFAFIVVSVFAITESKAQIVVSIRPPRPRGVVIVRPPRPSPAHVWVSEEWTPAGGTYAYHAGYWAVPPRPGAIWIAGHWRNTRGGSIWIAGHWR